MQPTKQSLIDTIAYFEYLNEGDVELCNEVTKCVTPEFLLDSALYLNQICSPRRSAIILWAAAWHHWLTEHCIEKVRES